MKKETQVVYQSDEGHDLVKVIGEGAKFYIVPSTINRSEASELIAALQQALLESGNKP